MKGVIQWRKRKKGLTTTGCFNLNGRSRDCTLFVLAVWTTLVVTGSAWRGFLTSPRNTRLKKMKLNKTLSAVERVASLRRELDNWLRRTTLRCNVPTHFVTFEFQSWRKLASVVVSNRQQVLPGVRGSLLFLWCQAQATCCSSFARGAQIDGQWCCYASIFADFHGCLWGWRSLFRRGLAGDKFSNIEVPFFSQVLDIRLRLGTRAVSVSIFDVTIRISVRSRGSPWAFRLSDSRLVSSSGAAGLAGLEHRKLWLELRTV